MKKSLDTTIACMFLSVFITACSQQVLNIGENGLTEEDGVISKVYYEKDAKNSFLDFLKNPDEKIAESMNNKVSRAVSVDSQNCISEDDMFAQLWLELSEDEKNMIFENIETIYSIKKEAKKYQLFCFFLFLISLRKFSTSTAFS